MDFIKKRGACAPLFINKKNIISIYTKGLFYTGEAQITTSPVIEILKNTQTKLNIV
jgi:hypothetical protein